MYITPASTKQLLNTHYKNVEHTLNLHSFLFIIYNVGLYIHYSLLHTHHTDTHTPHTTQTHTQTHTHTHRHRHTHTHTDTHTHTHTHTHTQAHTHTPAHTHARTPSEYFIEDNELQDILYSVRRCYMFWFNNHNSCL